jgi:hypothetical protein
LLKQISPKLCIDGGFAIDMTCNSILKPLGSVLLVTLMRCNFVWGIAPKVKSTSLFNFGGEVEQDAPVVKAEVPVDRQQTTTEDIVKSINRRRQCGSVRFDVSAIPTVNFQTTLKSDAGGTKLPEETILRKLQWYEESFMCLTVPGGQRQIAVLSVLEDVPLLSLFDPVTLSFTIQIQLNETTRIGPADKVINTVEIVQKSLQGFCLSMSPDDSEQDMTSRWLNQIHTVCKRHPVAQIIVKRGYLQKRGRLNTAFRWRWFELSSDLKLRYFKADPTRLYKGQIDLSLLDIHIDGKGVSRFEKELLLSMRQISRKWVLRDDNESDLETWRVAIFDLVSVCWGVTNNDSKDYSEQTFDDEEDEDDE